jgi:hypothetical protein
MQRISISTHSITSSRPAAEGRDARFVGEHHLDRLLYIEAFAVSVREDRPHGGGGLLSAQKSPFSKAPNPIALTAKRGLLIC